jgi:TPR repeat protein
VKAEAQYNLGVMHMHQQGRVGGDEWDALRLWTSAAELGLVNAMTGLGSFHSRPRTYTNGTKVPANATIAFKWTKAAADSGDRGAKHELGMA